MLSAVYTECCKLAHYAEYHGHECCYAECRYVECRGAGSTVVEHLPHHPKVKGLSPAAVGTGREKKSARNKFELR